MKNLFKHFKGDFFGGITAGIVALPLALAFGVSSGLGPDAGLYGAIFIGIFAAMFGGTPSQISGPTAPMTAVSLVVISSIIAANDGDLSLALPAILGVFFLSGLIQIALGAIQIGKYIRYIPYPVVSGFMTAIGVIILATQFLPVLGYYPKEDIEYVNTFKAQSEEVLLEKILKDEAREGYLVLEDFTETQLRAQKITEEGIMNEAQLLAGDKAKSVYGALTALPRALNNTNLLELCLALLTIIIIYGFKRITTAVPSTLVALFIVSFGAVALGLDYKPIPQIPEGFPTPRWEIFTQFDLARMTPYFMTAISLALLGSIDSLLTSVVADNMTKTRHNPNKELVGQGIGNSVAAFFGGIPGAGATIRTVVNINAGGKTRLSGIIAGLLLLVILLSLGPIASRIPAAVLAGILVTVGIGVMDYKGLKAIRTMQKSEVFIMLLVLVLSVFWDLVSAVGLGMILATLIFMKKIGDATASQASIETLDSPNNEFWTDEKTHLKAMIGHVFIKHLNGPIFFGSTSELKQLTSQIPAEAKEVIVRMDKVPYIDQTGLYTIEDIILDLNQKDIKVSLVGLNQQPAVLLEKIKIIPILVPKSRIFKSFEECLNFLSHEE
ncbi:SulP family inorganic anion transporter [Polaribacter sp.]|jgi:sulfate permease, SulP family|uniref:SulP family inorganic anion transporter n=1 Tax=Polaribacter sp. TaxID=1920175 RepID=UPI0040473410